MDGGKHYNFESLYGKLILFELICHFVVEISIIKQG
jgi:hypothetical protein